MIRKLQPSDIEQTMQIWLAGNLEAHHFVSKEYWITNYESVKEQLLQADVYVYAQGQEIQGFVGMSQTYLAGIFVLKTCRSKGIGRKLIQFIKQNYPTFSLHVFQKNKRAVDFYLREGLQIVTHGVDKDTKEADYLMKWV